MADKQKGWVSAREAQARAQKAHRKQSIVQARKGNGAAPGYRETSAGGCLSLFVMVAVAWLIGRVLTAGRWPRG